MLGPAGGGRPADRGPTDVKPYLGGEPRSEGSCPMNRLSTIAKSPRNNQRRGPGEPSGGEGSITSVYRQHGVKRRDRRDRGVFRQAPEGNSAISAFNPILW